MLWFYTAIGAALCFALVGVIGKKVMQETDSLFYTTLYTVIGTVLYIPVFIYFLGQLELSFTPHAAIAMFISGIGNTLGILALNAAIKKGDLSTAIPLNKLQPVFAAIIGFLFLQEQLTSIQTLGVVATTAGGYIVLLKPGESYTKPVKSLKNEAPKLAVFSAIAMATAAVSDRFATQQIDPKLYLLFIFTIMSAGFITYNLAKKRSNIEKIRPAMKQNSIEYLLAASLTIAGYLMIFTALSEAAASKVIPVLQIQVILNVIAGGYLFKEENIGRKLVGSIILIAGVALIAI